jgi:hypothetical protein
MALARAKELDDIFKKTGKVVGPLHGLPISLKDQFRIKVSGHLFLSMDYKTDCRGIGNHYGVCVMDRQIRN